MDGTTELVSDEIDNALWGSDWPDVRRLWALDSGVAHLNHGSFGAVPRAVQHGQDLLRQEMEANPVAWFRRRLPGGVSDARQKIAAWLGVPLDRLALVTNASAGITAVLSCLQLSPGDEILMNDHAYGAVEFAVDRACRLMGAVKSVIRLTADVAAADIVAAYASRINDRTRLLVVDQVTSATARRFPVEDLTRLAAEAGVRVLVDGAHAPGMLDFRVEDLKADFWVGNLHKWPCAPRGTAALAVSDQWKASMRPLVVSWREDLGFPDAFDAVGTADLTAWLAAPAALELLAGLGWTRLRRHNAALAAYGQTAVAAALGVPESRLGGESDMSMRTVPLPAGVAATDAAANALQDCIAAELRAEVAIASWKGAGHVRLSAHAYNRPAEYERLGHGLARLLSY